MTETKQAETQKHKNTEPIACVTVVSAYVSACVSASYTTKN